MFISKNNIQHTDTSVSNNSLKLSTCFDRLAKEKSIFRSYRNALKKSCGNETLYCKCTEVPSGESVYQSGKCSNNIATSILGSSLPGSFYRSCNDDNKSKRSTNDWYEPDDTDVTNKTRNITALRWPTPSGIDETRATNICKNKLRQTSFWGVCASMKEMNFSTTIDTCVNDIKVGQRAL